MLDSDRFADKAPAQVWAILLDEGIYWPRSHHVPGAAPRARSASDARRPPTRPVRPELVAAGPDQVWTWDITKLKGPGAARIPTCT